MTVFETVLRAGSVKAAARELNVSQPAVSQALKGLEDHIGTRLLDRGSRPAALTETGRILQAGVREGLDLIADAILQIKSLQSASDNSVTVACSIGTATYWLMPRLSRFYAHHPDIAVNVLTTVASPAFVPDVDMVIRYGLGDWTDGKSIKLFGETVVPVCAPELQGAIEERGGLETATLLHVRSDDRTWLTWKEFLSRNGLPENKSVGRHFTNYVQATQAALSGQGVMLGWQSNTGDLIREGRLVALDYPELTLSEAFYLVIPETRNGKETSRLFVEWIETMV